jgi:hypothetical protein
MRDKTVVRARAWLAAIAGAALMTLGLAAAPALAADTQMVAFLGQAVVAGGAAEVEVDGRYAYLLGPRPGDVNGLGVLRVLDVGDPAAPSEVGHLDLTIQANGLAVQGGFAYITGQEFVLGPGQLIVVELSTPASPRQVTVAETTRGTPRRSVVDGGHLYVFSKTFNASGGTLDVFDLANPAAPTRVGSVDLSVGQTGLGSVAVGGGRAYVLAETGLRIVDVSDPAQPRLAGSYAPPSGVAPQPLAVAASGRYAYLVLRAFASGTGSPASPLTLRVVDAADPARPTEVGATGLGGTVAEVPLVEARLDGTVVHVALAPGGLRSVSVADPARPIIVASAAVPERPSVAEPAGGLLYLTERSGNVLRVARAPATGVTASQLARQLYMPVAPQNGAWAAVGGATFVSSLTVQNRGTGEARAAVLFLNPDGSSARPPHELKIAAGGNQLVYLPSLTDLPSGRYAVAVAADEPILAQANLSGTPAQSASYDAVALGQADATLYAPGVFRRYVGLYSSTITLHNPGAQAAQATVTYRDANGAAAGSEQRTIPAGGTVDLTQESAALPDSFVGAALIGSDRPLVGAVHVAGAGGELSGTSLLGTASRSVLSALPQVYKNYSADGWISSILLQNVGDAAAAVTITFRPYGAGQPIVMTDTIPANGMRQYYQGNQPANLPDGFAGAATVQATSGSVVATVNARNARGNLSTTAAFPLAQGSVNAPALYFPSLYNGYSALGWSSSFILMNATEGSTTVTISYYDQNGLVRSYSEALTPFEARLHYQPSPGEGLPVGFQGSAVVTGGRVIGVANVLATTQGSGDWLLGYEGFVTP